MLRRLAWDEYRNVRENLGIELRAGLEHRVEKLITVQG